MNRFLLLFLFFALPLKANVGPYIGATAGANHLNEANYKNGIGFHGGLLLGYACKRTQFHFELKQAFRSNHTKETSEKSGSLESEEETWTTMFSLFYQTRSASHLNPLFGGGLGIAFVEVSCNGEEKREESNATCFAQQLLLGLSYDAIPCAEFALEYRALFVTHRSPSQSLGLTLRRYF